METMQETPQWSRFSGQNAAYLQALYEKYEQDPLAVDEEWRRFFEQWGAPELLTPIRDTETSRVPMQPAASSGTALKTAVAAANLVSHIRNYGHLAAKIYPFASRVKEEDLRLIDPAAYRLQRTELEQIPAETIWENAPDAAGSAWEAIERLTAVYTQSTAYQFKHVNDNAERDWLTGKIETEPANTLPETARRTLLYRLAEVEEFERFLHRTFQGQKRFSIEGMDILVPMLDEIVRLSVENGKENVMIGMAHRGRLNVLAHVLGKPYEAIFSEFHHAPNKQLVPSEGSVGINFGWTGDVKYHLGANREILEHTGRGRKVRLTLANNPSHLEFVDPVVLGFARAAQEKRDAPGFPQQDLDKAISVLVHGDASFPGEGVVEETLNLSRLPGYRVGGTIHIVANNGIGFTTESRDGRSTKYASDIAKGFEIPIVHVNADDPEACMAAVDLAYEYLSRFHKDFLIDLIGYRRFGHNESDDPMATQPALYRLVEKHPTVASLYAEKCVASGLLKMDELEQEKKQIRDKLQAAYDRTKSGESPEDTPFGAAAPDRGQVVTPEARLAADAAAGVSPAAAPTGVALDTLRNICRELLQYPADFKVYPKLDKILRRRASMLEDNGKADWGLAETLAFATILAEGKAIRMTGQDTERGTFAHRHLMLHDVETGAVYSPLHRLSLAKASFAIHNSPLSETSVLGFEYGYSVHSPQTLVIWEAQFGDFVNAAQVILDQFMSSGRAKWGQTSALVLLLPHGYEGQGPEHSSGRLERFLQLSAENNWFVCNVTTAAQYFHLLRRQSFSSGTREAKPLILMSPKSLLRHPRASSAAQEFSEGLFREVMPRPGGGDNAAVTRLVFCSGKVAVDLEEAWEQQSDEQRRSLQIVRLEQLYPFPEKDTAELIQRFARLREIVWVQEEPRNMGAWSFVEPRLRNLAGPLGVRYVGRPERSSPAEGLPDAHRAEQERIVSEALQLQGTLHTV